MVIRTMKRVYQTFLIILIFVVSSHSIDKTSPSIYHYYKAMVNYRFFFDIKRARRLFALAIKRDESFLAAYMGIARVYRKMGWYKSIKKIYDRAWNDCREPWQRKILITEKARLLYDVFNNRPKARAFMNWVTKRYKFRQARILKRRFYLDKNRILRFPVLKRRTKKIDLWHKKYNRRKFSLLFWHPDVPDIRRIIYRWRRKARRLGFTTVLFTPVSRQRAVTFLRQNRIRINTFYSQKGQDLAEIFGIDLIPHCYYLGRYKEILFSGHPDHISWRLAIKMMRL